MSEQNRLTLLKFIESVWNRGELKGIESFIDDAYTIHHDPGDPWEHQTLNIDGFKDRVRESRQPIPDQTFRIRNILSDESLVYITWQWNGTHLGKIDSFEATGKELKMSGATVYFFDKGKINGHWQIADRFGVYQQLMSNSKRSDRGQSTSI